MCDDAAFRDAVSDLWQFARKVDRRLNNGGLPTPRNDRERRMCHHWRAVGLREAAIGLEEMLGLEVGTLDKSKTAHNDGDQRWFCAYGHHHDVRDDAIACDRKFDRSDPAQIDGEAGG